MKIILTLAAATLLVLAGQTRAYPHGGAYVGPAGEIPPDSRDPTDPQPPPESPGTEPPDSGETTDPPNGPETDPPKGPTEPGDVRPPRGPGTSMPPGSPGDPRGGVASGRRRAPKPLSYESWLFWWGHNKARFLDLNARRRRLEDRQKSGGSIQFFGGAADDGLRHRSPTEERIREQVVPALLALAGNTAIHPDIRSGALIALARAQPGEQATRILMEATLPGNDKMVRESAALALGIQSRNTAEVRGFLSDLAVDDAAPRRTRCFAMASLGLVSDSAEPAWSTLRDVLEADDASNDVPVSALLSMSLLGRECRLEELLDWYERRRIGSRRISDLEEAWIVSALGRTRRAEALPAVKKALLGKNRYARRSAAIALGQILPDVPEKTRIRFVRQIATRLGSERDLATRNFAVMSLGRIGARDAPDGAARAACADVLLDAFRQGSASMERPYAALALGVLAFQPDGGTAGALAYRLSEAIRPELAARKGDKVALGALAIALGLIGDRSTATQELLTGILTDGGEERKLRGAAAVALGLIGDRAARKPILDALREREDRGLRVDTAIAAGLLGDPEAVAVLVDVLQDPKASQYVLGSAALALGQIGDERAIQPLLDLLQSDKVNGRFPDLTRALVTVALGQIADRRDFPVLYRVSEDINYRATTAAIQELLTIL